MHRDRVEDALDRGAAGGAARQRVVGHPLHHLEGVALLAAVLVDGHGTPSIGVPNRGSKRLASAGGRGARGRRAARPASSARRSRRRGGRLGAEVSTMSATVPTGLRDAPHRCDPKIQRYLRRPESPASALGFARRWRARRRDHGEDRRALQAARLHLPVVGDLRRAGLDLRLRPLRRAAEDEREGRVVARR